MKMKMISVTVWCHDGDGKALFEHCGFDETVDAFQESNGKDEAVFRSFIEERLRRMEKCMIEDEAHELREVYQRTIEDCHVTITFILSVENWY